MAVIYKYLYMTAFYGIMNHAGLVSEFTIYLDPAKFSTTELDMVDYFCDDNHSHAIIINNTEDETTSLNTKVCIIEDVLFQCQLEIKENEILFFGKEIPTWLHRIMPCFTSLRFFVATNHETI